MSSPMALIKLSPKIRVRQHTWYSANYLSMWNTIMANAIVEWKFSLYFFVWWIDCGLVYMMCPQYWITWFGRAVDVRGRSLYLVKGKYYVALLPSNRLHLKDRLAVRTENIYSTWETDDDNEVKLHMSCFSLVQYYNCTNSLDIACILWKPASTAGLVAAT